MRNIHQYLIDSAFRERYLALTSQLQRVRHLVHSGIESYYAGLTPPQLKASGIVDRASDQNVQRTLANLEIGLEHVMGTTLTNNGVRVYCGPRPPQGGEKTREAIWRYDVAVNSVPAAAIGLNFHTEDDSIVATVANIQGRAPEAVERLKSALANPAWPIEILELILDSLPQDVSTIRGIASGNHPFRDSKGFDRHRASNLYDRTFRSPRIGMTPVRVPDGSVSYYETRRT